MAEPTVQVPVSLIRSLHAEPVLSAYHRAVLAALLSQPTPTAEPHTHDMGDPDEWHVTRCKVCGLAASAEFMREQCQYATPPRIEDMAPGTTFTARFRGLGEAADRRFTVMGAVWVRTKDMRWEVAESIDPSTIRDVTPPPTTGADS